MSNLCLNLIQLILYHFDLIHLQFENGYDLLTNSIKYKNYVLSKYLIEHGVSMNTVNNHMEVIQPLINDINIYNLNDFEILNYFIDHGLDVNRKDNHNNTPLIYGILALNNLVINNLLDHHADVNYLKQINIDLALFKNILIYGKEEFIESICNNYNINVNEVDEQGNSMLFYGIQYGYDNVNVIQHLVQCGININECNENEDTPLMYAIKYGRIKVIQYLINEGVELDRCNSMNEYLYNINKKYNKNKKYYHDYYSIKDIFDETMKKKCNQESIQYAINTHNEELIKYLIDKNASFSRVVLIKYIVNNSDKYILNYWIQHGMDINYEDEYGISFLNYSISIQKISMIKYLIENYEININSINRNIKMIENVIINNKIKILKYLIKHHLNINKKDCNGMDVLDYVIKAEKIEMIKYLIECEINISSQKLISISLMDKIIKEDNKNLISIFCHHEKYFKVGKLNDQHSIMSYINENKINNRSLIEFLIKDGIEIHSNEDRLFLAIENNDVSLAKELIYKGINLNVESENGTLLNYAIQHNNKTIIQYLVENGADINKVCKRKFNNYDNINLYYPPLLLAIHHNNEWIVKYLIEKGANINIYVRNQSLLSFIIERNNLTLLKLLNNYGLLLHNLWNIEEYLKKFVKNAIKNNNIEIFDFIINEYMEINENIFLNIDNYFSIETLIINYNKELVKCFIDAGDFNIDIFPFESIINQNDEKYLRYLIYRGVDINKMLHNGSSLLSYSLKWRNFNISNYLIYHGADINIEEYNEIISFNGIISPSNFKLLKFLIYNSSGLYNNELLKIAIEKTNDMELIKYITKQIKCKYISQIYNKCDGIVAAIKKNDINILKYLIEDEGFNINCKDTLDHGRYRNTHSPLTVAIERRNLEIVKYLIHQGADLKNKNIYDINPLSTAIKYRNLDIIKYLLQYDVDINNEYYNDKEKPIDLSFRRGNEDIINCLLDHGATVHEKISLGVIIDSNDRNLNLIKKIFEKGGSEFSVNKNNCFLHLAIENNSPATVKFLLEKGLNINQQYDDQGTPLMTAILNDDIKTVTYLIEKGANIDQEGKIKLIINDRRGEKYIKYIFTPLMCALFKNNLRLAKYLINTGADIYKSCEKIDNTGKNKFTALEWSAKHCNKEINHYLLNVSKKIHYKRIKQIIIAIIILILYLSIFTIQFFV